MRNALLILLGALSTSPLEAGSRTPEQIWAELKKTYAHNTVRDPHEQLREFSIHPDFEVNLFVSSPWVINPIAITWDARGRLWVLNGPSYPQILPGQEYTDFISVLEDTDGDGTADECTVFYDRLYVPTGLELGDGGVYVANQPDLLFLQDTDGDLQADVHRVFLSGFGTEDNHHAISAFRWGPGGWLYFQSGEFLHTQVETPHGIVRLVDGGVFQLRPRRFQLEFYNRGTATNPWGHAFDSWGQSFLTEGPQGGIWYLAPATVSSHPRERVPGTPAPRSCGVEFIQSRHFHEDYQGVMVLNAVKNKTVNLYRFSDDGAGFATRELQPLLIVSNEPYFRPTDVKVGPDGAIYITDFFQPLIGHTEYGFRDDRRDHLNGRIWRVTQKGRKTLPKPELVGLSVTQLVEQLKSPESFTREKSRRLLYEEDPKDVAWALAGFLKRLDPSDPQYDRHRLEALWMYQTIDVVEPKLLQDVLRAKEPRARAAATRVLRYWLEHIPTAMDLLKELITDDYPRARLETICALSYIPSARAMELAAMAVDKPMDRFLDYAFKHTAIALEESWLPALEASEIDFGGHSGRLEAVLSAVNSKGAVTMLLQMLESGQLAPERRERVLTKLLKMGGEASVAILERLDSPDQSLGVRYLAVAGLAQVDVKFAAGRAAELLSTDPGSADPGIVLEAILSRRGGVEALETSLDGTSLHIDAAKLGLRYLHTSGKRHERFRHVLKKAAGSGSLAEQLAGEEMAELVAEIREAGDARRGEEVYRRGDLACQSCHAIAGGGPLVGPDLEGLGASSPLDYIIEAMLYPDKAVREGFAAVTVTTESGKIYNGIQISRDQDELVMRDAATREVIHVAAKAIVEEAPAGSIMAPGLVDMMTRKEFVDLARFIGELGRPGSFAIPDIPVLRTWRVLEPMPPELASKSDADLPQLTSSDGDLRWRAAYSTVSGELPASDMGRGPVAFVQSQLDVGTGGKIGLRVNSLTGLTLWVDSAAVPVKNETVIEVERGIRTLTFRVDLKARDGNGLRVVVEELPGSPGRAQVVKGP